MQLMQTKTQTIGTQAVQTVCARQLHQWLGIKKDFSDWFKAKINALELIEGVDYFFAPPERGAKNTDGRGGHNALHYDITADIGKHISMTTHTPQGRVVRNFFIELEKNFTQELQKQLAVKEAIIATYEKTLSQITSRAKPKSLEWEHKKWTNHDDQTIMHLKHKERLDTKRIAQRVKRNEDEVIIRLSYIQENPETLFKDY
jgi:phage anti-repressor protein